MLTATETAKGRALQEIRNQAEPGGTEDSRKQSSATPIRIVILLMFLVFVATSIASDIFDVLLIVRTLHSP